VPFFVDFFSKPVKKSRKQIKKGYLI